MKVSKKLLMNHRTERGAWTRAQFKVLGLPWPPTKGWQQRIIGKELTKEELDEFIRCKGVRSSKDKTDIQKIYLALSDRLEELTEGQLVILRDKLNNLIRG